MLNVYLPVSTAAVHGAFEVGSAIVGEDMSSERVFVHYEPPTPASNIITFADRVYHAADRLRHQVATSKICAPLAQELVHVAYFDENEGRVIPMDADAELLLAQWLGMSELLGSQLECEGAQHFARQRELMAVAHGHNPGLAWWARQQLRQRGSH